MLSHVVPKKVKVNSVTPISFTDNVSATLNNAVLTLSVKLISDKQTRLTSCGSV